MRLAKDWSHAGVSTMDKSRAFHVRESGLSPGIPTMTDPGWEVGLEAAILERVAMTVPRAQKGIRARGKNTQTPAAQSLWYVRGTKQTEKAMRLLAAGRTARLNGERRV